MMADWRLWCRLCGKCDNSSIIEEENVKLTIQKHFSILLLKPAMSVCNECHGFVKKLEEFDERCGKVDTMFNELVSSDEAILDSDEIFLQLCRRKFGLDKRENTYKDYGIKDCFVMLEDIHIPLPPALKVPEVDVKTEATFNKHLIDVVIPPEIDTEWIDEDSVEEINENINSEIILDGGATKESNDINQADPLTELHKSIVIKCPQCSEEFSKTHLFREHLEEIHSLDGIKNQWTCATCSKRFKDRLQLINHEKSHSTEKRMKSTEKLYACSMCPKRFCSHSYLKRHEMVHLEEKLPQMEQTQWKYSKCQKIISLSVQTDLKKMKEKIAIPEQQKNYIPCEYCGRSYVNSRALNRHIQLNRCTVYSSIQFSQI